MKDLDLAVGVVLLLLAVGVLLVLLAVGVVLVLRVTVDRLEGPSAN